MSDYRLGREALIQRIEYLRDAQGDEDTHTWIVLDRLLADAKARKVVVPQLR